MPIYIGDYLADTMHLTTEQHGAYLLLLFHLWRRGSLPANDASLARIAGLSSDAWSNARAVLQDFFESDGDGWHHRRVERERERIARKQESNSQRARSAALGRWQHRGGRLLVDTYPLEHDGEADRASATPLIPCPTDISSNLRKMPGAMPEASKSDPHSNSELEPDTPKEKAQKTKSRSRADSEGMTKAAADPRHFRFRGILAEYWAYKNPCTPEMPWQGRDAKALSELLCASPGLEEEQFRQLLRNRARSAVAHGDRVYLWIANLTRYQEEIGIYNKPAALGGANASRAEINCNSVTAAVGRALEIARRGGWEAGADAGGTGQAGDQPATLAYGRVPVDDGAGSGRCALAIAGDGHYGLAEGDAEDGQAGADGSLSDGAATARAGRATGVGELVMLAGECGLAAEGRGSSKCSSGDRRGTHES